MREVHEAANCEVKGMGTVEPGWERRGSRVQRNEGSKASQQAQTQDLLTACSGTTEALEKILRASKQTFVLSIMSFCIIAEICLSDAVEPTRVLWSQMIFSAEAVKPFPDSPNNRGSARWSNEASLTKLKNSMMEAFIDMIVIDKGHQKITYGILAGTSILAK